MKNNRLEVVSKIIFFGAVWGIVEATLGYVLHLVPGYLAGSIMFPFVMFILYRAYKSLGTRKAIFFVAFVAMMIKSVNLLLPFMVPAKTINPMVSMFVESLLVFAVIPLFENKKILVKISAIAIASIGWRLAFVGYQGLNFLVTDYLSAYLQDFSSAFNYVVLQGLLSTVFAASLLILVNMTKTVTKFDRIKISPIVSVITFALAIVLTIFI